MNRIEMPGSIEEMEELLNRNISCILEEKLQGTENELTGNPFYFGITDEVLKEPENIELLPEDIDRIKDLIDAWSCNDSEIIDML